MATWRRDGDRLVSTYQETAPQAEASALRQRIVYLSGGWGSGKTSWLLMRLLAHAAANPGLPLLLASPTYPLQRRTAIPALVEWMPGASRWPSGRDDARSALGPLVAQWRAADRILVLDRCLGGGEVHFGSAEIPGSLEGATYAGVFIDEPRLWSIESWRVALARLRHPRAAVLRAYVAGVPEMGWMWDELRGGAKGRARVRAPTSSNPHLPAGYLETLRQSLPARHADAYLEGEFVHLSGSVFSGYDPDAGSVIDTWPEPLAHDGALDFGHRRPHLLVVADCGGTDVVVDEVPGRDILEGAHAERCADALQSRGIVLRDCYCDPAGNARNAQTGIPSIHVYQDVFHRRGVMIGSMRWTTNPVERHVPNGIAAVQARLLDATGQRRLFVAEPLTRRTYDGGVLGIHQSLLTAHYRGGDRGGDGSDPNPVHDETSHSTDALRYLLVGRHGVLGAPPSWAPPPTLDDAPSVPAWAADGGWRGDDL